SIRNGHFVSAKAGAAPGASAAGLRANTAAPAATPSTQAAIARMAVRVMRVRLVLHQILLRARQRRPVGIGPGRERHELLVVRGGLGLVAELVGRERRVRSGV